MFKNPKQLSSWEGWILVSDPQLGFWCKPCMGWLGTPRGCLRPKEHLLTWAGLLPCRCLWLKNCQGALQQCGKVVGKRESGQGENLTHCCKKWLLSSWECFGRWMGWTDALHLPNLSSGDVPSLSGSVPLSSPTLKILSWNVPSCALSHAESLTLSSAGRKQSSGTFRVLQEGHNQLPRTIIKRIGT